MKKIDLIELNLSQQYMRTEFNQDPNEQGFVIFGFDTWEQIQQFIEKNDEDYICIPKVIQRDRYDANFIVMDANAPFDNIFNKKMNFEDCRIILKTDSVEDRWKRIQKKMDDGMFIFVYGDEYHVLQQKVVDYFNDGSYFFIGVLLKER